MKVCVPTMSNKNQLNEQVFNHFGSASYFTIYDTDSKTSEIIENDNSHHNHGSCQPVNALAGHKVDAVLTGGMGRRAIALFNEAGIRVFLLEGGTVAEAIEKFEANLLKELDVESGCGGHGHHEGCH
jgi:predicted Fe-Mo cluster-binding NifX family protein